MGRSQSNWVFDAEESKQPLKRLSFPFFPHGVLGVGLGGSLWRQGLCVTSIGKELLACLHVISANQLSPDAGFPKMKQ